MNADELLQLPPILRAIQPHLAYEYNIETVLYRLYNEPPFGMGLLFTNVRYHYMDIVLRETDIEFVIDIVNHKPARFEENEKKHSYRQAKRTKYSFDPADPHFLEKIVSLLRKHQCLQ